MYIPARVASGLATLAVVAAAAHPAGKGVVPLFQQDGAKKGYDPFSLTVDSIMRGPKLVGYPPTGLGWSGDSSRLYFEWRRPGDDEASTWVVGRDGGGLRHLSDAERLNAPPVNGVWDKARRRVLFVDQGDIVLLDSVSGKRRNLTRTSGAESNPRWAKHETAATFVRENNLYVVPIDSTSGDTGVITQLTDVSVRKRDPRETDSQKFIKEEEQKLIEHTRVQAEKRKKAEEKEKTRALPKYELAERQSATDLQLSPDDKHVFMLIVERTETAKRPNVPNYVTESSYTEDIPARTYVGDAQDKRTLAVMNLETGKTVTPDASFAGTAGVTPNTTSDGTSDKKGTAEDKATLQSRPTRWGMPQISEDGTLAVANVRATDNKDRWLVAVDPESGNARVIDALHDDAWIREVGGF